MRWWIVWVTACGATHPATEPSAQVAWPPIVDSHVHLALDPVAEQLAAHGVEVAIDLAGPERTLGDALPIQILRSGPMLTHPDGYPLDGWGHDGYGLGCADAACVTATVDRLVVEGARVIKIAGDDDGLAGALVPVAVAAAHAHHVKVAIHALSNAGALAGALAGCDVLAHTPIEALAPGTIEAWASVLATGPDRAVISTLAAFGGSASAVDNLRRLRAAGLTVLYGTDLGNLRDDGPSHDEIVLLRTAGLDDAALTAAMTTVPLAFWGITPTTQLVLDGDPRVDVSVLLAPRAIRPVR